MDGLLHNNAKRPLISFEFFPPKTAKGEERFWEALEGLAPYRPDFISVTYGAGGGDRENTGRLVCQVQEKLGLPAMAHLTCIGEDQAVLERMLDHYRDNGITHILALRGDRSDRMAPDALEKGAFQSARQLTAFIRRRHPDFRIGVAAYPEVHPEAASPEADLAYFQDKIRVGADFAITQFFYENAALYRFTAANRSAGVTVPIIPGIMPITDFKQIKRFADLCGAVLPDWLVTRLAEAREDVEAMQRIGIQVAVEQCRDLLRQGVPGLHFFTLNRSDVTSAILDGLGLKPG
ncbi:MAG: methylenetetrahydrofolate reductase [NAD(P)H] [Magnetococcales bacterium]|nr:methylenetetrahydrofolate reductase [NAD(P)H] [Magnetococcales bacterium]